MDKLGKLLRFVMQINSCIDCYFETQTFHPHLSYNPKSGWVGLFQPHVDIKDQFLHICIMLSNIRNVLETEWKLTPKKQPRHFQWPHLFEKEPICCNSHPFSCLGYFWPRLDSWGSILASKHGFSRVDIDGSYRPELRFLKIKLCLFVSQ